MQQIESMKKKKTAAHPSSIDRIPISEALQEDRYVDWITYYGWYILVGAIGLFALLFLIYRTGINTRADSDYYYAEKAMTVLQSPTPSPSMSRNEAIRQLKAILKRRPELHAKYDATLAQILMIEGLNSEATLYADRSLQRLSDDQLPFYNVFAKTTLLINSGDLKEALTQSEKLKGEMLANLSLAQKSGSPQDFGSVLFAYNLLRISFLQQALGNTELELSAWKEWQDYTEGSFKEEPESLVSPSGFEQVRQAFVIGDLSLSNYIQKRLAPS